MAETKKTTKKAPELSLNEQLAAKRADLIEARRGHRAGELTNPRVLGVLRRDIARIMTQINTKESN